MYTYKVLRRSTSSPTASPVLIHSTTDKDAAFRFAEIAKIAIKATASPHVVYVH